MKIRTIVAVTFIFNCAYASSFEQDPTFQQQKGDRAPLQRADKYDYKVLLLKNGIYLKFLGNDSKAFGPFKKHGEQGDRYIYIPKDRPQEFGSAMQLIREKDSNEWLYTDNWVQMHPLRVNPSGILPMKREADQPGAVQQATKPVHKVPARVQPPHPTPAGAPDNRPNAKQGAAPRTAGANHSK